MKVNGLNNMQYIKHNSTTQAIKPANAHALANAILNVKSPTRKDIAKLANVTEMTVCRAISRLSDSGFIQENTTSSGANTVSIADNLKFIIIDLTLDEYCAYLLSSSYKAIEQFSYTYNHSIDISDNLAIFLDRAKATFAKKANHFSGIAVISDIFDEQSKSNVLNVINQCFASPFCTFLSTPECLSALKNSAIDSHFPANSMYYICLGRRNTAYYLNSDFTIKSNPSVLVDTNGNSLGEKIKHCISPEILTDIVFEVVNSASAILDAKLFLIESDRFILGGGISVNIAEKLKLRFKDGRKLFVSDAKPNYYIKGAAVSLQKELIKNILAKS